MKRYVVAVLAILVTGSVHAQTKDAPKTKAEAARRALWLEVYRNINETTASQDSPHKTDSKCSNCHEGQAAVDSSFGLNFDYFKPDAGYVAALTSGTDPETFIHSYLATAQAPPKAGVLFAIPGQATRSILSLPKAAGLIVRGTCEPLSKKLAGLKEHDIVLTLNDKPAKTPWELDAALAGDQHLTLVVMRDGEKKKLERQATKSAAEKRYLIGVTMSELDPVIRSQMKLSDDVRVFVKEIAKDGAAEEAGVKPHDIFVRIDGELVPTIGDVQKAIQKSKGQPLKLDLRRGKDLVAVELKAKLTGPVTAVTVPDSSYIFQLISEDHGVIDRIGATVDESPSAPNDVQKRLDDIEKKMTEILGLLKAIKSQK